MKIPTSKNLIDFRRKTPITKLSFLEKLYREKQPDDKNKGGDYWRTCTSAILRAFKENENTFLDEKIEEKTKEMRLAKLNSTRIMYQSNIDVISNFPFESFEDLKPDVDINPITQTQEQSIVQIRNFPIKVIPSVIFTFSQNNSEEIGSVLFVMQKNGFKQQELEIFNFMSYTMLQTHYSEKFFVNSEFCSVMDLFSGDIVKHSDINKTTALNIISQTVEEIKFMLVKK